MSTLFALLTAAGPTMLVTAVGLRLKISDRYAVIAAWVTYTTGFLLLLPVPIPFQGLIGTSTGMAGSLLIMTDPTLSSRTRTSATTPRFRWMMFVALPTALVAPLLAAVWIFPGIPRFPLVATGIVGLGLILHLAFRGKDGTNEN